MFTSKAVDNKEHVDNDQLIMAKLIPLHFFTFLAAIPVLADSPIIIAHRGASGYVPEHTMPAYSFAHALGADYIEQDVVLTSDGVPIIMHDIVLDTTTNVATVFPERHREDGHYYAIDFTLDEIHQLRKGERLRSSLEGPSFPNRFPAGNYMFEILTLRKTLTFIQGLNTSTGRVAGIYPEIKKPQFHEAEGIDLVPPIMEVLDEFGYLEEGAPCFINCFDADTLKRVRNMYGNRVKLIQLTGTSETENLISREGVEEIATYADGIGPRITEIAHLITGDVYWTSYFYYAKMNHLLIHPWTFRRDNLPFSEISGKQLLEFLFQNNGVNGIFTDFPDIELPREGFLNNIQTLGDGWGRQETLGYLYIAKLPWVYHTDLGWLYFSSNSSDQWNFYDYYLDWVTSTDSLYPLLYAHSEDDWLYYYPGTKFPHRWFFHFNLKQWIQES